MKNIMIALVVVGALIGGYFLYTTTLQDPVVELTTESRYNAIKVRVNLEENDNEIDFTNSKLVLYKGEKEVASKVYDGVGKTFRNLNIGNEYTVKLDLKYKKKSLFGESELFTETKAVTQFKPVWEDNVFTDFRVYPVETVMFKDGSVLVASRASDDAQSIWLVKYSRSGEKRWEQRVQMSDRTYFDHLFETDDGEFVISGFFNHNYNSRQFILRFDSEGKLYSRVYVDELDQDISGHFDIATTKGNNGEIVFASTQLDSIKIGTISKDNKVNTLHNILPATDFENTWVPAYLSIYEYDDNHYVILTQAEYDSEHADLRVILVTKEGELIWDKAYPYDGRSVPRKLVVDESNIVVIGYSFVGRNFEISNHDTDVVKGIMFKVDALGDVLWDKYIEDTKWDLLSDLALTHDSKYVVAALSGTGGMTTTNLVRYDKEGNEVDRSTLERDTYSVSLAATDEDIIVTYSMNKTFTIKKY